MFRKIGECFWCRDPIYDHQEMVVQKDGKTHLGCHKISEVADEKDISFDEGTKLVLHKVRNGRKYNQRP